MKVTFNSIHHFVVMAIRFLQGNIFYRKSSMDTEKGIHLNIEDSYVSYVSCINFTCCWCTYLIRNKICIKYCEFLIQLSKLCYICKIDIFIYTLCIIYLLCICIISRLLQVYMNIIDMSQNIKHICIQYIYYFFHHAAPAHSRPSLEN